MARIKYYVSIDDGLTVKQINEEFGSSEPEFARLLESINGRISAKLVSLLPEKEPVKVEVIPIPVIAKKTK
jgi:hypothetical protein